MPARPKPNELYIERLFEAPVEMVWEAWTDPEQVAQWWGPRGFTITTKHKDVRTGGSWLYTMHGPDGVDYPNHTKYLEVEPYARLVYDHGGFEDRPPLFRVTVTFSALGGKTKMEMTMAFATERAAQESKVFIKKAGGESTWDRLAEYLAPVDRFVINRTFEAPIDVVFEMWTKPEHLARWLLPTGFTMSYLHADIKPGGSALFRMSNDDDLTMFGKATYREIQRPQLLAYTQNFCDERETMARHPLAPTWPAEMLTRVVFAEEDVGRTRVTVEAEVHGEATDTERDTFRGGKPGMTQGWTGSFDKLETILADRG